MRDLKREHERLLRADYVGDSWSSDVLPAVRVGMRAVWLNRYRLKCPNPSIAREITSIVALRKSFILTGKLHLYFTLNIRIMNAWMKAKEFARIIGISLK